MKDFSDLPVKDVILGIDFATRRTGLAVLELRNPGKLIHYARIIAGQDDFLDRWGTMLDQVAEFMAVNIGGRPVCVAIEQPNTFCNGTTVRETVGGWGMVMAWIHRNGMPVFEVNTAHAKAAFCGKGGGGKQQTIDQANARYGLQLKYHRDAGKTDDDVADAIQVAWVQRKELIESDPWFLGKAMGTIIDLGGK